MTTALEHAHRVHEFLLSPKAYPDKPKQVELKETHISWVYLTDRYVYKQKKPVRFEFLDFSTLERRQHFCEQEVTLNQRFSPEVYHGVVIVSCDAEGNYRLTPGKNVAEYLVKMTRLDEKSTLENLILNEELTETHVDRLSQGLTKIYSDQAPAMLRSQVFLQSLTNHVLANRNDLLISLPGAEVALQFVTNAQLRCLSLESNYFLQRVADGRVVDGHGDLRPEHVYFHRSKPLMIDCIEFNAEYRTNDVIDELAFLSMECDRLGNHEVGESLLASYTQASNDSPPPFLAEFYKCYRACVRAKVAALRANQIVEGEKAKSIRKAQTYITLAQRYATELGAKVVIMVGGLSGTGKSTLASALREPLAAEVLQTDIIRSECFDPNKSSNGKYTPKGRKRVYDAMISRIGDALFRSPTVILDGTFSSADIRRAACEKASELGAKVLQVQCECPAHEAKQRISHRITTGGSPSEAAPELYGKQAKEYEAVLDTEPLVRVNTTLAAARQMEGITSALRELVRVG